MSENVDLLYLSEEEMINADVLNMKKCVDTIDDMFHLISKGDFILGGPNRNDHGIMLWFNKEEPFANMPVKGPDRRFMSLISYLGGEFDVIGNKWYGSNIKNIEKGLPRSIHTFTLNDKDTGAPLSIMAGNLISSMRTGAVSGVAACHLARKDSTVLGVVGGGAINQTCVEAITTSVSGIEKIILYDIDIEKGKEIANKIEELTNLPTEVVVDMKSCINQSDIVTVATSGKNKPFISNEWLKPGSTILLTGAAEFPKVTYEETHIVADLWSMHEKWLEDGLAHPDGIESILDWTMSGQLLELIHNGEFDSKKIDNIGDIITGQKQGRQSDSEVIISMTGGLPTEDVAWGYKVYKKAVEKGIGTSLPLWESSHLTK